MKKISSNSSIIYGFHAVNAFLLRFPKQVQHITLDLHRQDKRMQALIKLAEEKAIAITYQTRQELTALLHHAEHQGVMAFICDQKATGTLEQFLDNLASPFLLILDGIQDPHNLGACLRTANAAGVDAVIAPKDRAVGMTPVVTKVASGATLITPFFQVTNLARTLKNLRDRGIWLFGTSEHATKLYNEVELTPPLAILMGSEEKGLRRLTEKYCDILMRIPMLGSVSSLNVSVATGICLFEVIRQKS
jgi:23S rRNA (guanosine2251-2'-O)-methyltransferase